jgi:hypothetical protein
MPSNFNLHATIRPVNVSGVTASPPAGSALSGARERDVSLTGLDAPPVRRTRPRVKRWQSAAALVSCASKLKNRRKPGAARSLHVDAGPGAN